MVMKFWSHITTILSVQKILFFFDYQKIFTPRNKPIKMSFCYFPFSFFAL